jgi:tripartite-type tricarboxylate transporter receptor subunit TctC
MTIPGFFQIALSLLSCGLLMAGPVAQAQPYPSRSVTMILPFGAGGTSDVLMRMISPDLSKAMGQSVIIDHKVGANGAIAEEFVARAKPDGHTVLVTSTSIATNPSMMTLSWDPQKAFVPVMLITSVPLVMAVHPQVKAQNVREFVELAKRQPKGLNFSSWGNGSIGHFAGENLQMTAQIKINHIPYKSTAQALNDVLGGQVDAMFPTLPLALPHIKAGKLRALGLTSPSRSSLAPDIPTMAETGFPNNEIETWFAVFLPAGTDASVVQKLHQSFKSVLNQPEVKERLDSQGFRVIASSPDELGRFLTGQMEWYSRLVKAANIKAD